MRVEESDRAVSLGAIRYLLSAVNISITPKQKGIRSTHF
jgi:hypothetical protein